MADSLLAAAAAVTSQPGFEQFDQNIDHTDRHNIPDCYPTVSQKFDDDIRPDLAQPTINALVQEPPPPYSQFQSLPQHRPSDDSATLVQPAAEISQIPAQAPPQPEPEQLPRQVQDPESDPRYKCLVARDQNTGDCCTISFPNIFLRLNKLYGFELQYICAPSGIVNRLGNLNHSPILQRAFIAGWAMLTVVAFPLVPQFLRCLWVIGQLVIVVLNLVYTCVIIIESDRSKVWAQLAVTATAMSLALVDMLYVCCRTEPQEGERQPLIGNERNQRMHNRFAMWLWKYNDLLRLIITEAMGYAIVVTTLKVHVDLKVEFECQNISGTFVYIGLLYISSSGFIIFVYVVQFLVICRMLYICWWMRRKSSTSCQGAFLIIMLLLLFIGERIIQGFGLYIIGNYYSIFYGPSYIILIVGTCLLPVLSIVTYFIRSHGEIVDFCIVYCTSYLRELEQISERPGTSLDTKNSIQALLRRYEFEDLQVSSAPYFKYNWRNLIHNCYRRLISPVVTVLSLPYTAAGVLYLLGIIYTTFIDIDLYYCPLLSGFPFPLAPIMIAFFFVVNVHTLSTSLVLFIYIITSPIAALILYVSHAQVTS